MNLSAVIRLFRKEKIVTIAVLAAWLSCSVVTARRRLKGWRAYTSYNHNGRYYTLPEIAEFDADGLWRYRGVFFSKHGNLKQTVVHLVVHSSRGLSGSELGELLGLQPRSFLSHFRDHPALCREKVLGRWIWFAADPDIRTPQKHSRVVLSPARMPSDLESVMILVDLIHHPDSALEPIARRLKRQGFDIEVDMIRRLLKQHGVLKKTVAMPSSDV